MVGRASQRGVNRECDDRFVYVCACIVVHVRLVVIVDMRMGVLAHVCAWDSACTCSCVHQGIHVCTLLCLGACVCDHMHVCMYMCMSVCVCDCALWSYAPVRAQARELCGPRPPVFIEVVVRGKCLEPVPRGHCRPASHRTKTRSNRATGRHL